MIHSTLGLFANSQNIPSFQASAGSSQPALGVKTLSVSMPVGADGDFYLFIGMTRSAGNADPTGPRPTFTIPSGWTPATSEIVQTVQGFSNSTKGIVQTAYRVGSSEPSSYAFSYGGPSAGDDGAALSLVCRFSPVEFVGLPDPAKLHEDTTPASPYYLLSQPTIRSRVVLICAQYDVLTYTDTDFAPAGYTGAGYAQLASAVAGNAEIFAATMAIPGGQISAATAGTLANRQWATIRLILADL